MKRILIPTDGSGCSEAAIRLGLPYAKALGAEVTFLFALEDVTVAIDATAGAMTWQPELHKELKRVGQKALERAGALAAEVGVPRKAWLAERQHPVDAIHEAEQGHDLVVMGTHGRRGFNRFVFGSVAEEALRRAESPYLMIRPSSGEGVGAAERRSETG